MELANFSDYRQLNEEEVSVLLRQGCTSDEWSRVFVSPDFMPEGYSSVHFVGQCYIARQDRSKGYGVSNVKLANCAIAKNVLINEVHLIKGYYIEEGCTIQYVNKLLVDNTKPFAHGLKIDLLDETGGRSILAHDLLTAPLAYFVLFARSDEALASKLQQLEASYLLELEKRKAFFSGYIGTKSAIEDCGCLVNLYVNNVAICNVPSMESVYLCGTRVHSGAILNKVIAGSGTDIGSYATITNCFIGKGTTISEGFSAEACLIFDQCHLSRGEAVASVLGPHTASHHRSSLLVGSMVSFFNAGSGTNQSNHHYKLGPMHYGIAERGCKTASNAYVLWPAHFGAFCKIVGRVTGRPHLVDFPCSTVTQEGSQAPLLQPGNLLASIGLYRDIYKWQSRNKKNWSLTTTTTDLHNDATVYRMLQGYIRLRKEQKRRPNAERYIVEGCYVLRRDLEVAIAHYRATLLHYLVKTQNNHFFSNDAEAKERHSPHYDLLGSVIDHTSLETIFDQLRSGKITSLLQLGERLSVACNGRSSELRDSVVQTLAEGTAPSDSLRSLLEEAKEAVPHLLNLALREAERELNAKHTTSFGLFASSEKEKRQDMQAAHKHLEEGEFLSYFRTYIKSFTKNDETSQ